MPNAAQLCLLSRSPRLSSSTQTWLPAPLCRATQSGPSSPNQDYAQIWPSSPAPQSAPPSTEAAQGQCSAQTVLGTVHRGPGVLTIATFCCFQRGSNKEPVRDLIWTLLGLFRSIRLNIRHPLLIQFREYVSYNSLRMFHVRCFISCHLDRSF